MTPENVVTDREQLTVGEDDGYGKLVTKRVPDGIEIIGRIKGGKFFFGSFDKRPLEETPTLKSLDLNELGAILNQMKIDESP
jgi:hypothetical protein